MESSAEQRASKYIAGLKKTLSELRLDRKRYRALLEAVERYLSDAEYYLAKGDAETALVTVSYAEGLLDALGYLGLAEVKWVKGTIVPRVVAAGTFDLLHPGHIYFLHEASKLGELHVIIARDKNVEKSKGRTPIFPEDCRLRIVSALRYVKKAVLGDKEDYLRRVVELRPDIVVLGPDQPYDPENLREKLEARGLRGVRVIKIPSRIKDRCPTSSTEVIKTVLHRFCGCSEKT